MGEPEIDPDEYPSLEVPDVVELLAIHPETVRRLARRGELPGYKIAGKLKFCLKDVRALAFGQPIADGRTERPVERRPRRGSARPPIAGSLASLDLIEQEAAAEGP